MTQTGIKCQRVPRLAGSIGLVVLTGFYELRTWMDHGMEHQYGITGRSLGGLLCAPRYVTGYLCLPINSFHVRSLVAVPPLSPLFQGAGKELSMQDGRLSIF